MAADDICTKKLIQNRISIKRTIADNLEFCKNSKTSRNAIKKFIINNKLIDYKCHVCGITNEWNGKTLVLQLEHLNGINDDNRIENLAFICPNCHSQTETFAGRNVRKRIFLDEKKIKEKESYEDKLHRIKSRRKFDPTAEELRDLLEQKIPFTKLGKMFGVTDNAVRKRCRYYKLIE